MSKNNEKPDIPIRLDKWLWCARFYKTRSIATDALKTGKVTVNGERAKPSKSVKPGDLLDIRKGPFHHMITVIDLAKSRKSATDAAFLYEESPDSIRKRELVAARIKAESILTPTTKGRPSKKDRRSIIKFKNIDT
ncbi:MAG: ribosome-associated heat shock protein Hsp15 [Gammaproteobacteria bacterium]|jgi:ribosome-associated heat shock protein Hsp15